MTTRLTSSLSLSLFATLMLVCVVSCESPDSVLEGNPLDPNDPSYQPPETTIDGGPTDGTIVGDANVTFSWSGNEGVTEYSYRLDEAARPDKGVSSGWAPATSATFELLNEGDYTFSVKARYPTGIQEAQPKTLTFTVDAVAGPALMLYPRSQTVQVGETFSVQVMLEEVTDVALAHIVLNYDAAVLLLVDVKPGERLVENGTPAFVQAVPERIGRVDVSMGIAPGDLGGLTGSGSIVALTFEAIRPTTTRLSLMPPTELRAPTNRAVRMEDPPTARIVVLTQR